MAEPVRRSFTARGASVLGEQLGNLVGGRAGAMVGKHAASASRVVLQAMPEGIKLMYQTAAQRLATLGIDADILSFPIAGVGVASIISPAVSHAKDIIYSLRGTPIENIPEVKNLLLQVDEQINRMNFNERVRMDLGGDIDALAVELQKGFSFADPDTGYAMEAGKAPFVQAQPRPSAFSPVERGYTPPPLSPPPFAPPPVIVEAAKVGNKSEAATQTLGDIRANPNIQLKQSQVNQLLNSVQSNQVMQAKSNIDEFLMHAQKLRKFNTKHETYGYSQYDVREQGLLPAERPTLVMGEHGNYFM